MKRTAASLLLLMGLAACGGDASNENAANADSASTPVGMGPDSATPATPTTPQDSATARDLADAPAAGTGMGRATARVRDAAGKDLGEVTLTEVAQGIQVAGTLRGLPAGEHAMHLHTTGKCEAPFESAGPHWNPTKMQHGSQAPGGPHMGDLPNVTVAADGSVTLQGTTPGGTLRGANGLIDADGAALMIHGKQDDYKSQPGGDAGPRVACGVVEMGA